MLDGMQKQATVLTCRLGIMEDLQPLVLSALSHNPSSPQLNPTTPGQLLPMGDPAAAAGPVAHETLVMVHALFSQQQDVKLRHLAFMLLSRLGGLPPTLYRPLEEPEAAGAQGAAPSPPPLPSPFSVIWPWPMLTYRLRPLSLLLLVIDTLAHYFDFSTAKTALPYLSLGAKSAHFFNVPKCCISSINALLCDHNCLACH